MNRPKEKDYFDYYFKRKVLDSGNCESYIGALEEYIDHLELKQSENVVLDGVILSDAEKVAYDKGFHEGGNAAADDILNSI